jgi:hypothetical protein
MNRIIINAHCLVVSQRIAVALEHLPNPQVVQTCTLSAAAAIASLICMALSSASVVFLRRRPPPLQIIPLRSSQATITTSAFKEDLFSSASRSFH